METKLSSHITPQGAMAAAAEQMDGSFKWGVRDCIITAGNAFYAVHGINPVPAPTWNSELTAWRHARRMGGMVEMTETYTSAAGLRRCGGVVGALGLVPTSGRWPAMYGFCVSDGVWALFAGHGFKITEKTALAAWSV